MKIIEVAVGILQQPDGRVLLSQRPTGKPYAGWWEFAGGKIENGETVLQALARELKEELGLEIIQSQEWLCVEHVYEHAHVHLHFCLITTWQGEPQSLEGQAFSWQSLPTSLAPILPAAEPVLKWLLEKK